MNKLLSASLLTIMVLLAASCKQDPQSANGPQTVLPLSSGNPAHPAITYAIYGAIAVMDSDGTHQTTVLSPKGTETMGTPNWSSSGGSIAYQDAAGGSSYVNSVKAMDISVNSRGVPVSSNVRTIYATQNTDTAFIVDPAWCSVSTTAQIAFVRRYGGAGWGSPNLGLAQLCTVSQSGGTPTVLASYKILATQGNGNPLVISHYLYPTWSPDDSKIAVAREDTVGHWTIMIYNSSTGAAQDSIPFSGTVACLEWSRTGLNKLLFQETPNSSTPWTIYYCDPTTGSTPTTNSVTGSNPTWSPNNNTVMYITGAPTDAFMKDDAFTSTTSTLQSSGFYGGTTGMNWKR